MRVLTYTCERVGYFSQVGGVDKNVAPVFRRMHREELKKINGTGGYEKTPFNCNTYVEDVGGISAAKPLEDFLIEKRAVGDKTHEFNVICRSSVLTQIYMSPRQCSQFAVIHKEQNIILEELKGGNNTVNPRRSQPQARGFSNDVRANPDYNKNNYGKHFKRTEHSGGAGRGRTTTSFPSSANSSGPRGKYINPGQYADIYLTMLPNEEVDQLKKFGESNLYVVVKHRYRYEDGTIVNLFVSKEIDAVEFNEEGEEMVSIDLKVGNFHKFGDVETLELKSRKQILMDYLAGGICYIYGIMLGDNTVHKIVVMDQLTAVCNTDFLNEFKLKIGYFLFTLATSSDRDMYNRIEVQSSRVMMTSFDLALHDIEMPQVLHGKGPYGKNKKEYDPTSFHHLVIVGSTSAPIKWDHPFYHTDVVTVDNFCKRLYHDFMCEPQLIFVYGKKRELEKVRSAMTNKELEMATFIQVK